jgi:hypothetical protein
LAVEREGHVSSVLRFSFLGALVYDQAVTGGVPSRGGFSGCEDWYEAFFLQDRGCRLGGFPSDVGDSDDLVFVQDRSTRRWGG